MLKTSRIPGYFEINSVESAVSVRFYQVQSSQPPQRKDTELPTPVRRNGQDPSQ